MSVATVDQAGRIDRADQVDRSAVGRKNKARGKRTEKGVCEYWGAERISHKGQGTEVDDARLGHWSLEIKGWERIPRWLWSALAYAEAQAVQVEGAPLPVGAIVFRTPRSLYARYTTTSDLMLAVIEWSDLPQTLADALDQSERNCPAESVPLVVIHHIGGLYAKDLVLLRYRTWEPNMGTLRDGSSPLPADALVILRARAFLDWFGA